jgi:hypothetical protein
MLILAVKKHKNIYINKKSTKNIIIEYQKKNKI